MANNGQKMSFCLPVWEKHFPIGMGRRLLRNMLQGGESVTETTRAKTTTTTGICMAVVILSVPGGGRKTRVNRRQQQQQIKVNMEVEMEFEEINEDGTELG